ncbi:MAG: universal stress protein [Steroidobacteraceae bacterium]
MKRILIAVQHGDGLARPTLGKLAVLGRQKGTELELYCAIDAPVTSVSLGGSAGRRMRQQVMTRIERTVLDSLDQLAEAPALRAVAVRTAVNWDYPAHEAIVRRALAIKADMIVIETHHHARAARLMLSNTDWELIRHCPLPLLLMKPIANWQRSRNILASIDPFHSRAKPAALDKQILRSGMKFAAQLGGKLHMLHNLVPMQQFMPVGLGQPVPLGEDGGLTERQRDRAARALRRIAKATGLPSSRCHLTEGDIAANITKVALANSVAVTVMGAVSRSAIRRIFVGNTAEQLFDLLQTDVLVVKPGNFVSGIREQPSPAY